MKKSKKGSKPVVNEPKISKPLNPSNSKNKEWLMVGIITLVAFILRVYGIGRFSFWFDEYLHIIPAVEFIDGKGLIHIDGINGRFTTYLEIIFLWLFGVNEFAGRLPMALFSAATVPILYQLAKKLFDSKIAFITIILFSISLYMIFWGRVARNYATFLPFYLLLINYLISFYEPAKQSISDLARKVNFSWKWLGITVLIFVLSLLNHPLTIFFVFAFSFYGASCWVINLIQGEGSARFLNKYTPLLVSFFAIFFMLTKSGNVFFRHFLGKFLPQNMLEFIVPDFSRLVELWNLDAFKGFNFYADVVTTDMNYAWILLIVGVIFGFRKYSKSVLISLSQFGFIFLLLAFVFREGTVTRYLYFIYPFYLMLVSLGLVCLGELIFTKGFKKPELLKSTLAKSLGLIIIVYLSNPSQTKAFLTRTEHGQLVDRKISEWYYTNWKDPIQYVKENMQAGDVILATVPNAPRLYMGVDSAKLGWFRQMRYDGLKKEYVQNDGMGKPVSGYTTDEFIATIQNNPRGWLLADYYFDNVMTDPKARQIAIEKLDFHFGASPDGSVKVFSWDNAKPKTEESPLLIELGKSLGTFQSPDLDFNFTIQPGAESVRFIFDVEGLDSDNEAAIQINNSGVFFIPKPVKSRGWGREYAVLEVPISALQNGPNKVKFMYNPDAPSDYRPGFVIYNVRMQ